MQNNEKKTRLIFQEEVISHLEQFAKIDSFGNKMDSQLQENEMPDFISDNMGDQPDKVQVFDFSGNEV